ncbi:class I SAM-dependent methyltransferase [Pedococcus sp. KACC 23699]|uniref:Class I SAM-dependent methyltransferase n=1 Tax=Pedococcus sp. KACC 23699 TaxID=3149228 RepID=A0AAU7JVV1_9MICO
MTSEPNADDGGDRALEVPGDSVLQTVSLESLSEAQRYHRWLTDLAFPHLGDHPVEIGSGLGGYARTWLQDGLPAITVTERDESRLGVLKDTFGDDSRVTVSDLDVFAPPRAEYSAMVAMNVLEHIEDHVGALRSAHALLRPGGRVIIFVPAFEFAMSRFDRAIGHYRRYTVPSLRGVYEAAGLEVETIHYVNAPGLLAWFAGMRLLRMTPRYGPTVKVWDSAVVPVARSVESRVRPPFGQSVFAVGRIPG